MSVYQAEGIAFHGASLDSIMDHLESIAEPDTALLKIKDEALMLKVKELELKIKELELQIEGYKWTYDIDQDEV